VNAPVCTLHGSTYISGSAPVGTGIHRLGVIVETEVLVVPARRKSVRLFKGCAFQFAI